MRVFHHVLLKYCHENAEMQKRKFDDVTLQYSALGRTEVPAMLSVCGKICNKGAVENTTKKAHLKSCRWMYIETHNAMSILEVG